MSPLIYGAGFSDGENRTPGPPSASPHRRRQQLHSCSVSDQKKISEVILDFLLSHPTSNALEILQTPPFKQIRNHPLPTISTAEFCTKNPSCLLTWHPDDSVYSLLRSQGEPFFFKSIRLYWSSVQTPTVVSEQAPEKPRIFYMAPCSSLFPPSALLIPLQPLISYVIVFMCPLCKEGPPVLSSFPYQRLLPRPSCPAHGRHPLRHTHSHHHHCCITPRAC